MFCDCMCCKFCFRAGIVQLLIESAPRIGCVPSNVYAVKKPAPRVEVPPAQNHKDTLVHNHKKPEVAGPVSNHITEESNGRNLYKSQGSAQNGLDKNVCKVPDSSEMKFQKSPDSVQKVQIKPPERVSNTQSLPENGLNVHKLPDKEVNLQNSADGLLKSRKHRSEKSPENGPIIQNSQDSVLPRVQNHQKEEKPVATVTAPQVLNEEEHPPSPRSKDKELITPTSWTGKKLNKVMLDEYIMTIVLFCCCCRFIAVVWSHWTTGTNRGVCVTQCHVCVVARAQYYCISLILVVCLNHHHNSLISLYAL